MRTNINCHTFDTYSTKRVSYILITKDRASFLEKALLNAKMFKDNQDELIVVDGGSKDKTLDLIKIYSWLIDKYISEEDAGPVHAANKAILISSGKYIKYLTDDDVIYPDGMKRAISVMDKNPDIDVLVCGGTRYRVSTKKLQIVYNPPGTNYGKNIDDVFKHGTNAMGFIIRRSSLARVGIIPTDLNADFTFLVNCFLNGAIIKFCRIKLYHQYVHDKTINVSKKDELANLNYKLVKKHASRLFFYRFAINWFLWEHPNFKKGIFLPLFLWKHTKLLLVNRTQNKELIKIRYKWDAGFS